MVRPIIEINNVSKRYQLGQFSARTVREEVERLVHRLRNGGAGWSGSNSQSSDFWALEDVSFVVQPGEVIGIIGRNGAGKSTLLKILSRVTEPTGGEIRIRGRVASLLEVGTGFHPELTGRENIYLNGTILGMSKAEVREKFDEIVAFAEVEQFLETPVKRYSSGMQVRLAFAVAAHLEPEILLVDEVLAVGDASFQRKCLGKINNISGSGRTILFVSHNMQAVRQLCQRAVWLESGHIREIGLSSETVDHYLTAGRRSTSLLEMNAALKRMHPDSVFRLNDIDVLQEGVSCTDLLSGKPVEVRLAYDVLQDTYGLHVYFLLCDMDGTLIFESIHNGDSTEQPPMIARGNYVSTALIPANFLAGRTYELQIQAAIHGVREFFDSKSLPSVMLHVHNAGIVNRAYVGYESPGKLAPLLSWHTERL